MAKATDPRPQPNLEIYDFESDFEDGFHACFEAHQLREVVKHQNPEKLTTPRVECQFVSGQQQQRSYIVQGTGNPSATPPVPAWAYPNVWEGVLRVKIITHRLKPEQGRKLHRKLRGLVRWAMQAHDIELSARMKFLTVVQAMENGTTPEFSQTNEEDASGMSYAIKLNIKPTAFPTPS